MRKSGIFIAILPLLLQFNTAAFSQSTSVEDIQDLPKADAPVIDQGKMLSQKHWAYKSLESISKKYGLELGDAGSKFDGTKPLSRNEAALLLVNLVGKIEQNKVEMSESDKTLVEVMKQELSEEIKALVSKVAILETSVDGLKGSVSKLEESDEHNLKFDYGKNFKINGDMQVQYTGNFKKGDDGYPSNFSIPYAEIYVSGNPAEHLGYMVNISPTNFFNTSTNGILYDAFVSTDIIPHHQVYLGQTQVPVGQEGPQSILSKETIDKSQISRYSDFYDMGVKVTGNWTYADYYLGAYNGNGMNVADSNGKLDLAGWLNVRPFAKNEKLANLEVGGGYFKGNNGDYNRNQYGFYTGYKYKKYAIRGEYARIDGYGDRDIQAAGWYVLNTYDLTKKLQLVARFDQFDPDKDVSDNLISEYTVGGNYFLAEHMMLRSNLVYVNNKAAEDSVRLKLMTQYMF